MAEVKIPRIISPGIISPGIISLWAAAWLVAATAGGEPRAYIISPADGETVGSPFLVRFGLEDFGVAPAGVESEGAGHMHLIIDAPPPKAGEPIPADESRIHYGGGQIQAAINLPEGRHTLQLVVGDAFHVPIAGLYSEVITVTVR